MDKKQKSRLNEIRKKMRRLTLAEKKQIKEEKQKEIKQEKQREKDSKNKQKVTQRVKININVPSSITGGSNPFMPQQFNNKENITLLKSINEQLKKKNEQSQATNPFNIPIAKQTRVIETQTEQPQTRVFETQTEQPQTRVFETQTEQPQTRVFETQTEQPQTRVFETQTEESQNRAFETQTEQEMQPKMPEFMPSAFSETLQPIPIIKESNIPIITKPKDTSSEKLTEQVKPKMSLVEELKIKQKLRAPKTEEEILQMEAELKEPGRDPTKKPRGAPKLTEEEKIRRENEAELLLRKKLNEREIEDELKAAQLQMKAKEKMLIDEEARRIRMEKSFRQEQEKNEKRKQREEEGKKPLGRKPDTPEIKEQKEQASNSKAFRVLSDNIFDPNERSNLIDAFNSGYLSKEQIKEKLKNLRETPNVSTSKRLFTDKEITSFFSLKN